MSAQGDFLSYTKELLPTGKGLVHIYKKGRLTDYSGNGAVATPVGAEWINSGGGHGLYCGSGGLSLGDPVSCRVSSTGLSIIVFGVCHRKFAARLVIKRAAAGIDYMFYVVSTDQMVLRTAGHASTFGSSGFSDSRSLGMTLSLGSKPDFFIDGGIKGAGSVATTVGDDNRSLYIGRSYSGTIPPKYPLSGVVIAPDVVFTEQNMSDLQVLFDQIQIDTSEPQITSARPLTVQNPLVHLTGRVDGGEAIDDSDNAINFTKETAVELDPDTPSGGHGFNAHGGARGDAHLSVTDTRLDNVVPISFSFWVLSLDSHVGRYGRIYEKGALDYAIYYHSSLRTISVYASWGGTPGAWVSNAVISIDAWVHVTIRHSRLVGDAPQISVNGAAFVSLTGTASAGGVVSDTGAAYILDNPAGVREVDGTVCDFIITPRFVTQAEADSIYLRSALRSVDRGYQHIYPETLKAAGVGVTAGEVGPFTDIISGSHRWNSDNELECISSGAVVMSSGQAYGAWYFEIAQTLLFKLFLISSTSDYTSTDGYMLQLNGGDIRLRRADAGVLTSIDYVLGYLTLGVPYKLLLVRNPSSLFTLYIKGGTFTAWTKTPIEVTDPTYTNSDFIVSDLDYVGISDKLSHLQFLPYFYGHPNDIPWLAD